MGQEILASHPEREGKEMMTRESEEESLANNKPSG